MFDLSFCKVARFSLDDLSKSTDANGERGTFRGYASTFGNVDRDGDIVMPGAFAADIDPLKVKLLRQHKHADLIGVWRSITPDSHGLRVVGELNLDVQLARETYSLMKQGALADMSVGMGVPRDQYEEKEIDVDGGDGKKRRRKVRQIKKAILHEISLVSIPANPEARVTDVKALDRMPTLREFEKALDGTLFSRAERRELSAEYRALMQKAGLLPSDSDLAAATEAAEIRVAVAAAFADVRRQIGGRL